MKEMLFRPGTVLKLGNEFYRIKALDFISVEKTYSSLSANSTSSDTIATDIKPKEGQVYVFKIIPLTDNVKVRIKQPAAVSRGGTEAQPIGFLDKYSVELEEKGIMKLPIFATTHNRPITLSFVNENAVSVQPKVRFVGYKYSVEKIPTAEKYEEIMVSGLK